MDEHVVVVLVDDHEVVAEGHEVVAEAEEKREDCFSFRYGKTCVFTGFG